MRNCSFCGETGHNKLTCWMVELSHCMLPDTETTPRKTYCCSICGESGHNSQKCGKKKKVGSSPKKASRHCKRCGESGHNIRTCSVTDDLLTIPEPLCLPCSPSSPKPYKRKLLADTHTIQKHHVPTAGPCSTIVFT